MRLLIAAFLLVFTSLAFAEKRGGKAPRLQEIAPAPQDYEPMLPAKPQPTRTPRPAPTLKQAVKYPTRAPAVKPDPRDGQAQRMQTREELLRELTSARTKGRKGP